MSLACKTGETSIVEKLREEVACLTNDFGKFLENSKTFTTLLKFHQNPYDKFGYGLEEGKLSSAYLS